MIAVKDDASGIKEIVNALTECGMGIRGISSLGTYQDSRYS